MRNRARLAFALAMGFAATASAQIDPDLLAGMKARAIGPAGMSGRVAAIDALASDPNVVWIGAATGGVWKSGNGGLTWTPVFDDQPVASIGAVAINQKNPDVVWIGTGEGNPRNSASVGNGVYKTTDGGKTWEHLGLSSSERIHRILLHPRDPDVAWVAALGKAWGESPERGVYKTTDGGKSWNRVLYVDERTGCCDLVLDPRNPDKLLAGMWQYRRWPWFFKSGGPGSGLWVTHDGGKNWQKRTAGNGLPKGELGRIGLAIARSNPDIVYALVEAEKSALLRSTDGGRTFKTVNAEPDIAFRPFYYCDIRVDAEDQNRVYNLHGTVTVSDDGGKTFTTIIPWGLIHPDHHAMWISPENPRIIYDGNDGGVAVSQDRGKSWRFVNNLPLAQYYHISVDRETPYNIYGGMQDNGSWRGPSSVWENGGIRNHHWHEVFFGDGFATLADPENPTIGYAMSQGGHLARWNIRTGERKLIRPDGPDGTKLRFHWNAGIAIDPFESTTVYYGSQFLHRSDDRGDSWVRVSPDLTTNNKQWQKQAESGGLTLDVTHAENFCTILTIAPSPVKRGVLWVGTDDGRVQVTQDGGQSWQSVEQAVPDLPTNTWCPHIEASKYDAATAFAVFDNHRRSDGTTYAYVTRDYGKSWRSLSTRDTRGYAHVIEQDPVDEDLLFLGTEFGLFVSTDGGNRWFQWKHGLPTVAVRDLVVHPVAPDLVIGTHGRAAFVIDDIRPLRELNAALLAKPFHLFPVTEAQQYMVAQSLGPRFPGSNEFRAANRSYGALLDLWVRSEDLEGPEGEKTGAGAHIAEASHRPGDAEAPPDTATKKDKKKDLIRIEIFDAGGTRIRELEHKARNGLNRIVWDLRSEAPKRPRQPGSHRRERHGPEVIPGSYRIVARFRGREQTGTVQVLPDPRVAVPQEQRVEKWRTIQAAKALVETFTEAVERIENARADLATIEKKLQPDDPDADNPHEALLESSKELGKELTSIEEKFRTPPKSKGIQHRDRIGPRITGVFSSLQSSWDAPTKAQLTHLRQAESALNRGLQELNELFAGTLAEFRAKVRAAKIELLPALEPLQIRR